MAEVSPAAHVGARTVGRPTLLSVDNGQIETESLFFFFFNMLQSALAKLADISALLLENGETNLDSTVGEAERFLRTINGSSPAHETRTITPHGL